MTKMRDIGHSSASGWAVPNRTMRVPYPPIEEAPEDEDTVEGYATQPRSAQIRPARFIRPERPPTQPEDVARGNGRKR